MSAVAWWLCGGCGCDCDRVAYRFEMCLFRLGPEVVHPYQETPPQHVLETTGGDMQQMQQQADRGHAAADGQGTGDRGQRRVDK